MRKFIGTKKELYYGVEVEIKIFLRNCGNGYWLQDIGPTVQRGTFISTNEMEWDSEAISDQEAFKILKEIGGENT